jgi:hypothetical protein
VTSEEHSGDAASPSTDIFGNRAATAEQQRLDATVAGTQNWQRWGTYLSERAWGTVREDYSADGDAWNYFPYDAARSRAYRWNEDGLAGWCDQNQYLCFGIGVWNHRDDHLKERPFGLTNSQGNHGEDVKEYWFYTDNTPTHSWASMVYKYPQVPFPYQDLIDVNAARGPDQPEYELFDALESDWRANRYFDVQVDYAKADPEDVVCRITATNRGPEAATLTIAAQLWYRNTWSWEVDGVEPLIGLAKNGLSTEHAELGRRWFYAEAPQSGEVRWLFCSNETNNQKLFGSTNTSTAVKDGINDAIVSGDTSGCRDGAGSKAAAVLTVTIQPGGSVELLTRFSPVELDDPFADATDILTARKREADEYYTAWQPGSLSDDERRVQRQALAGLLWCKQFYNYHVTRWLEGDPTMPTPPAERWQGRNSDWRHLVNEDVLLMPDAWEYPWYAAWDMGFHCVTMAMVDPHFAKQQLLRLLSSLYQHPHGQVPAYEWNFSDTNPPVLAWAVWQVFSLEVANGGEPDHKFLATAYRGLVARLTNWLTTQNATGRDLFAGGFLGMDNISVFDRDHPLPTGGKLVQSDGTAWVAQMVLQMAQIALEMYHYDLGYEADIEKLLLNFSIIIDVLERGRDGVSLWNHDAGFYCDAIINPDGTATQLDVISVEALVPVFACAAVPPERGARNSMQMRAKVLKHHPEFIGTVAMLPQEGDGSRSLFAAVRPERLRRVLGHVLNPAQMLSEFGVRSLSAEYRNSPYQFKVGDTDFTLPYWPAESRNRMFGGNSNWRGPIWFPVNILLLQSLMAYDSFFGDTFAVEYPTGSGVDISLQEVAVQIGHRLTSIFLRREDGTRPVFGSNDYFNTDPYWRDLVPFYEYFDGDDGRGCGASHQTGWTATVALLLQYGRSVYFELPR